VLLLGLCCSWISLRPSLGPSECCPSDTAACLNAAVRALVNCGGCYIGVLASSSCSWWDCWPTLDRAIDASAPLHLRGGGIAGLRWGKKMLSCVFLMQVCIVWSGLASSWGVRAVRGNSLGEPVGGLVLVGHRPFVTCVSLRRRMWVACRWVKPERNIKPFGDPPGPGGAPCAAGLSAVFTLGRWRLPREGEAQRASEVCGTGGYLWWL